MPLVHAQKGSVTDIKLFFTGGRTACSPILVGADSKDFMWLERWDVYLVEFDNTWKQGKPALRLEPSGVVPIAYFRNLAPGRHVHRAPCRLLFWCMTRMMATVHSLRVHRSVRRSPGQ